MTVTKQLIDNVNKIKTTLNEISVYNLDVKTSLELYYELAKKVNEVINELSRFEGVVSEEVVEQNKKLIYLLGEGLKIEVGLKIDEFITNGTMDSIINHKIFNDLNIKLENYKKQADEIFNNTSLYVEYFGAKGDGSDETEIINNAILESVKLNKKLLLSPNKTYMVNKINAINNLVFDFNGGKLKKIPTDQNSYQILNIEKCTNVKIINPIIEGDKKSHLTTTGEWGHGINIISSNNIEISNPIISQCWGDGIYIGTNSTNSELNENIYITGNIKLNECRRQGISIVKGENIYIDDVLATNIYGTEPGRAVDIEPNTSDDTLLNIKIKSIKAFNCMGALDIVCRGGALSCDVGHIYSSGCKSSSVNFAYSEVKDSNNSNLIANSVNSNNFINIESITINNTKVTPVNFKRNLVGTYPNINIKNIVVNEFIYDTNVINDETIDYNLVCLLADRDYTINTYGNVQIGNISLLKLTNNSNINVIRLIDRSTKRSNLKNVNILNYSILDENKKLTKPFSSFSTLVNSNLIKNEFDIQILDSSNNKITGVYNIVKTQDLILNEFTKSCIMFVENPSLRFTFDSKIFSHYTCLINGVTQTNSTTSTIFQTKNRIVIIRVDEQAKIIEITYNNFDLLNSSSSPSTTFMQKGAIVYYGTQNIPIYCDGSNWRKFSDDSIVL